MAITAKNVSKVGSNLSALELELRELAVTVGKNEVAVSTLESFKANTHETLHQLKNDLLWNRENKLDKSDFSE